MRIWFQCHRAEDHLRAELESEAPPDALGRHLESCPRCRREWESRRFARQALAWHAARSADVPTPRASRANLLRRLRESELENQRVRSRARIAWRIAIPLATVIGCGACFIVFRLSPVRKSMKTGGHRAIANEKTATEAPVSRDTAFAPILSLLLESPNHESTRADRASCMRNRSESGTRLTASFGSRARVRRRYDALRPNAERSVEPIDDLAFLNASSPIRRETDASVAVSTHPRTTVSSERTKPRGDDFITVLAPLIAAANSTETNQIIRDAVDQYEKEKAIVDPRLAKKIDIEMKGGDLKTLVDALTEKTGVQFHVSKDLEDRKMTVLANQSPARDLMRQTALLFNLQWRRRGEEEGKYTYELIQTLKQKLDEEELKRKDEDQMILDATDQLEPYRAYLDAPPDQLKAMAAEAKTQADVAGSVEARAKLRDRERILEILSDPQGMDAFRIYSRLTPDQLIGLRNGQKITYANDNNHSDLPQDLVDRLKKSFGGFGGPYEPKFNGVPISQLKPENTYAIVSVDLDRSWPGEAALKSELSFGYRDESGTGQGFGIPVIFDYGQPSALKNPGNAKLHDEMKSQPEFVRNLALDPRPSDPREIGESDPIRQQLSRMSFTAENNFNQATTQNDYAKSGDWVDTADLFSELHQKIGMNIVADYYLRIYPKDRFKTDGKALDVLNDWADALKSNWDADGDFLRFRRVNGYAEREMDVPNRLLKKWTADRKASGILPLEDLAEIAALPEPLLNHPEFVSAVLLKWKLDEWVIARDARWGLQAFNLLNPTQRAQMQSNQGFLLSDLDSIQTEALLKLWNMKSDQWKTISGQRQFMRMRKDESYSWIPDKATDPVFPGQEPVRESAKEAATAKAKAYFAAHPEMKKSEDEERGIYRIQSPGEGLWNCTQSDARTFNWTFTVSQ